MPLAEADGLCLTVVCLDLCFAGQVAGEDRMIGGPPPIEGC